MRIGRSFCVVVVSKALRPLRRREKRAYRLLSSEIQSQAQCTRHKHNQDDYAWTPKASLVRRSSGLGPVIAILGIHNLTK
jgi:hypothetical protein